MWKLFQFSIFIAVLCSNVHYKWTPNGYAATVIAGYSAYLATGIATALLDLLARIKTWLLRRQQSVNHGRLPGF